MPDAIPNPLVPQGGGSPAIVPGGTPGTTPGTFPGATGQPQQPDAIQQILKMILSGSQQKPQIAQPTPAPVPGGAPHQPTLVGKYTGPANLGNAIGSTIQNAVAYDKKKKLAAATSDWTALITASQKYIKPDGTIDNAIGQDPAVMGILTDKKLKRMAKALNQDWLNPKPDEYRDGLNIAMKQHQDKQGAIQGLKQTFGQMIQHIKGQGGQPDRQVSPQGAAGIMSRAPIAQPQQDPKQAAQTMSAMADMETAQANLTRAQAAAREKYDVRPDKDGNLVAINKADPTDVVRVTTPDGRAVTSAPKAGMQPKPLFVPGGAPYGIARDGKVFQPGDPEWTAQDAKLFESAKAGQAAVDAGKERRIRISAEARAQAFGKIREYGVMDTETNSLVMVDPDTINQNPGRYVEGNQAVKMNNRKTIFDELDFTAGQVNQAINELPDTGFDAKSRAQISVVLRDEDPKSALDSFLGSSTAGTLSDAQVKYVTGLVSLQESVMGLKTVGGMPGASDLMRSAIIKMAPGAATPSRAYAQRQMQLLQGEISQYRKSILNLGTTDRDNGESSKTGGPPVGTVENGYRFKGGDAGDKNNWVKVNAQR